MNNEKRTDEILSRIARKASTEDMLTSNARQQRERKLAADSLAAEDSERPLGDERSLIVFPSTPVKRDERDVSSGASPPSTSVVCPICKGRRFLRADVPFGHPDFGKPIPCECKIQEQKIKRLTQLRMLSNLDAFHGSTFRTFNRRVPGVREAYTLAHAYAQKPEGWLLLVGANGCGKTHLAAAIANESLNRGEETLLLVVPDLLDHLRAAFSPDASEGYDELFAKMREAELLVLDDLGAHQSSPWANEKLFQLFNYRYNLGMPTVITANPKGLQSVDERIRSRLSDRSLVILVPFDRAGDYRPHKLKKRGL